MIRPILDRITVRKDLTKLASDGGIILSDPQTESRGTVVAVGPKVKDVKPGDYIFFGKYQWETLNLDVYGADLVIMKEQDVMIVLDSAA